MSIKVKRGLAINLPTLEEGELGFTTDSYEMYVGSDNGNILLNNGEILIRRNNGMLQYAQSSRKNQWFDICSLEEIRGDQGVQGIQGIQGVKGDKGDKGERGIQGEKGNPFTYADFTPDQLRALKGEKGDTGAKGERGLTGDKGDRGVGLNYSWSGTRLGVKRDTDAQYTYVDLRGADGKDGKQGERGERGIQGEKGDTPSIAHLEQQVSDKSKELDTKFNTLTAKQQQDAEVVTARDGEVSLHARLERDLEKGKIHFVDVEGSNIATESEEGYLENVEIHGNTWQDAENLEDIRSVGTKVEGQELYEIPILSTNGNVDVGEIEVGGIWTSTGNNSTEANVFRTKNYIRVYPEFEYTGFVDGVARKTYYYTYDKNKNYIKSYPNSLYSTMQFPSDVCYIRMVSYTTPNITLAIGRDYLGQYKENKLTILSPTPLEKVGDIADRIVCKDGVWGVEKNVVDYTISENDTISKHKAINNGASYRVDDVFDIENDKCVLTNMFLQTTFDSIYNGTIEQGFSSQVSNKHLYIRYNINLSLEEFKPLIMGMVVKKRAIQPIFIPLPHSQQIKLRTFAERTHISCDTEIKPTIKAQVPKSLGATVNTHTTQIDNLNKELDRVKKLEESTVSTITSNKACTTVAETTQGYFEDVKIEGKTLANRTNIFDKVNPSGSGVHRKTSNSLIVDYNKCGELDKPYSLDETEVFKSGQIYTIVIDILQNTLNLKVEFYPMIWDFATIISGTQYVNAGEIGRKVLVLQANKNYPLKLAYASPGQATQGVTGLVELKYKICFLFD